MVQHPVYFPEQAARAIASYDYADVEDGTGITEYMLCVQNNSVAKSYALTTKSIYSADTKITQSGTGTSNLDYDVVFNITKTVKGTAYANIPYYIEGTATSGNMTLSVEIIHYDGSTETTIGTAVTSQTITKPSGAEIGGVFLIKVPITTKKYFKVGETLRVTIIMTCTASGGTGLFYYGTDPKGRADIGTAPTTTSKILIPTLLNL